jgi:SAM-dependent methyltransferase
VTRLFSTASDGNNSLLDLGCGTGHFIPYAYEKGYSNYLGVDISPDMVALARLTYPTADIVVASAANFTETVPISQRKFDAIVSILMICALPSIRDIMDVFKESHKVLKDTGKLLVCVPHPAFDPYMQCGLYGENWVCLWCLD